MKQTSTAIGATKRGSVRGFSLIELMIVLCVMMIVGGMALPSFALIYRSYQLSDAASRVAGIMKSTRATAVKRNQAINCVVKQSGSPTVTKLWVDANGNGAMDSVETQTWILGSVQLVTSASVPRTSALATAVGVNALTDVTLASATIKFDQRGAVSPPAIYAFYVSSGGGVGGFRAVVLLPSGSTELWTAGSTGVWQRLD